MRNIVQPFCVGSFRGEALLPSAFRMRIALACQEGHSSLARSFSDTSSTSGSRSSRRALISLSSFSLVTVWLAMRRSTSFWLFSRRQVWVNFSLDSVRVAALWRKTVETFIVFTPRRLASAPLLLIGEANNLFTRYSALRVNAASRPFSNSFLSMSKYSFGVGGVDGWVGR